MAEIHEHVVDDTHELTRHDGPASGGIEKRQARRSARAKLQLDGERQPFSRNSG